MLHASVRRPRDSRFGPCCGMPSRSQPDAAFCELAAERAGNGIGAERGVRARNAPFTLGVRRPRSGGLIACRPKSASAISRFRSSSGASSRSCASRRMTCLWLRDAPGPREKALGKLAHDARKIAATGRVCRVADTTWYEVSSGSARGFANGQFLVPATEPAEETARFAKLAGASGFASPEALAQALGRALEGEQKDQSEVRFEANLIGVARSGTRAVVVLYACCYPDDSVMGEQILARRARTRRALDPRAGAREPAVSTRREQISLHLRDRERHRDQSINLGESWRSR